MILTIKDETFTGEIINEFNIEMDSSTSTVKEIISSRVKHEVEEYNSKAKEQFMGLIVPTDTEKHLNGYKLKNGKVIDYEEQIYIALNAFSKNAYFMLIDDIQVESLEQKIILKPNTKISFVKLTPLVGG